MSDEFDAEHRQSAVKRSPLVTQVIEGLKQGIASGRWPVGSRLPPEIDLAAQFDVSRMTFRQAVQALVHAGLLQTVQGSGTFVTAATELEGILGRYTAGENLVYVLEVRDAIEVVCAGLAAERRTDADLVIIESAARDEETADAAGDLDAAHAASARFHTAIVNASGNPLLINFYAAIQVRATKAIAAAGGPQTRSEFRAEHRAIADAVNAKEPRRARTAMQLHIDPVIDALKATPRE